jgi:PBP1b-binding outer membrane lipoprotein LpoB
MTRPALLLLASTLALAGCSNDRPVRYPESRPPVDSIDPKARGLQGADVERAADAMARDLLALDEINRPGAGTMFIVVDKVEDKTYGRFDLSIFLQALRTKLIRGSGGRIQIIENRARFHELRSRELESEREIPGIGGPAPGPAGDQPDFSLYAIVSELPERSTSYFRLDFQLTSLNTRRIVWGNEYAIRTRR